MSIAELDRPGGFAAVFIQVHMALGYKVLHIVSPVSLELCGSILGQIRKTKGKVRVQAEEMKTQSDPLLIGQKINICLADKLHFFFP